MSLEKLQWKSKNLNILNSIYTNSWNQNLQVDGDITLKLKSLKMSEDLSFQLMSASNQKRKANYLRELLQKSQQNATKRHLHNQSERALYYHSFLPRFARVMTKLSIYRSL